MEARFYEFFPQIFGMLAAAISIWAISVEMRMRSGATGEPISSRPAMRLVAIPLIEELAFRMPLVFLEDGFGEDRWIAAALPWGFAMSRFFLCLPPLPDDAPETVRRQAVGIRLRAFVAALAGGAALGWIVLTQHSLVLAALVHIAFKVALFATEAIHRRS